MSEKKRRSTMNSATNPSKQDELMSTKKRTKQRGVALVETALVAPIMVVFYIGAVGSNMLMQANRALSWAVNQSMLMNDLRTTPTTTSAGNQTRFDVRFVPGPNGGTYNWVLPDGTTPLIYAIPSGSRDCSGGETDIACAAWLTMTMIGQFVNSSQGPASFDQVDISVRYADLPVEAGVNPSLGKYRKATILATGSFNSSTQATFRNVSGIGSLLPSFTVSRTEAIG